MRIVVAAAVAAPAAVMCLVSRVLPFGRRALLVHSNACRCQDVVVVIGVGFFFLHAPPPFPVPQVIVVARCCSSVVFVGVICDIFSNKTFLGDLKVEEIHGLMHGERGRRRR